MFENMFDMIAESAEVALAREEYRKALEGLRAQVLTTPEDGTPEEQETWVEEWHRKVVRGPRLGRTLGVPAADKAVFIQMHGVCATWRAEAAQRAEEEKQRVAREREEAAAEAEAEACIREAVRARQEEMARERERAAEEVRMGEPVDEEDEENEEAGEEETSAAMVVSLVATPTKKAKTRDPRLTVVVPPRKHQFTEAFHKGRKDFEPEDPLEGDKVTTATAREESKGRPQCAVGDLIRRGAKRCEACVDKRRKVCWGEDKRVCQRCQMKRVGCSKSTKALREREMSEHSGVSKGKARGKAKAIDRPGGLEQGVPGPSNSSTSAHPWPYPVPMTSVSRVVVEADLLPEDGRSMITNQKLNALVRILGCLTTQGSFIEAQVQNLKARAMDLNVEVWDVQETHGKYSHQLEYAAAQLGAVLHEAKEFPVEEEESGQEESEQ
ncbi:hypothetical protein PAXINDRAFT_16285 [Paxillus involutus ATCC 200175]|uniref:Zn(2)-C6 fungal-type domain-containing protein n=1 Tax=Paxillus involutus ATCC 200175 TaxID=664439 RepID=A0A0C9SRW2_PAXIN|nr:hypothetical protein PAXINDRAFT_16285 [Paxillus involutus ATCC 200175]